MGFGTCKLQYAVRLAAALGYIASPVLIKSEPPAVLRVGTVNLNPQGKRQARKFFQYLETASVQGGQI